MKLVYAVVAAATFSSLISAAGAAPPTVTPSPGYDARLQEERAAQSGILKPIAPTAPSKSRRNPKRRRHHAH